MRRDIGFWEFLEEYLCGGIIGGGILCFLFLLISKSIGLKDLFIAWYMLMSLAIAKSFGIISRRKKESIYAWNLKKWWTYPAILLMLFGFLAHLSVLAYCKYIYTLIELNDRRVVGKKE